MSVETTVHTDEYTIGGEEESLTFADDALIVGDGDHPERILGEDIVDLQIYTEQGLSGFKLLGNIFGCIGVLMGILFIGAISGGFALNIYTLGTVSSSILAFTGLVHYRNMNHNPLDVLVVETADETHRFVSHDAREEFEQVKEQLYW